MFIRKPVLNNYAIYTLLAAFIISLNAWGASKKDDSSQTIITTAPNRSSEKYENLALFQKVLHFIEQNYVEEVKNKELIYGAIKGMMETLDPHSNFLPPEIFKDMKADTSGQFGGVGIEIGMKDSVLTVVSPIEDTPAYKAGIKPGDKLIKINGESTKGLSLAEAVTKMRGKKGSNVVVTIYRKEFSSPKDIVLTRENIKIATVKSEELDTGYLYARLTNFNENSFNDLKNSIDKYERELKKGKLKGLVFDLRNNPGGLLDQAVDVTSLFLDDGVVVSTLGRNKDSKEIRYAKKGFARKDYQVAVLVNGNSASASEIVAGALQDHKRAVIMGQPTFGKGSVQTVVEVLPEVGLKLTIARYYTPSGRSIQLKGIQPDVILDEIDYKTLKAASKKSETIREKDLKRHMNYEGEEPSEYQTDELATMKSDVDKQDSKKEDPLKPIVAKEDYQVREALNYIKSYQVFRAAELAPQEIKNIPTALPTEAIHKADGKQPE